jgi:hypothetical protein
MSEREDVKVIQHIISVTPGASGFYMVETEYPETDALNAVGKVLRAEWDPEGDAVCLLNTNDTLSCMWRSPSGALWIGSARGNVWTNAPVTFTSHRMPSLQYEVLDKRLDWKVTTLPNMEGLNYRPNITAIWGTADSQVFAATYKGIIYRWDGAQWTQAKVASVCLNHIHGSSSKDIYCVGFDSVILHYDGARWSRVPYPDNAPAGEVLTGVRVRPTGDVLICGRGGTILEGRAPAFRVLAREKASFYGLALFNDNVFLAGGESGVWQMSNAQPLIIKPNVKAVGVFESPNVLFFIEAAQEPRPRVVEHDPNKDAPWFRVEY